MAGLRPVPTTGATRLGEPARGWPATDLVGLDPAGQPASVVLEAAARPLLLVFLAVECDGCDLYWEGLRDDPPGDGTGRSGSGRPGGVCPPGVDPVILTRGPAGADPTAVAGKAAGITRVPVVMGDEAWAHYRVTGYPFFVLVDPGSRTVAGETVGFDWTDVTAMVGAAIGGGPDGG